VTDNAQLTTARLQLRRWTDADRAPFADLNADPRVMEHLSRRLSRAESDELVDRIEAEFAARGFGLWAVEVRDSGMLAGFVGLHVPGFDAHFTPAVEIGWRLAHAAWGHGYATEAARAVLDLAFGSAGLAEVVSMTTPANLRSQRVMQRLGMHRDPADDFDHPSFPDGHRLRRHILYRITAAEHRAATKLPGHQDHAAGA
jgi:ribosomal-protein-alanine N-acetyltransferase